MKKMKRIGLFVPKTYLLALNKLSDRQDKPVSQLIRDAIFNFLKKYGAICLCLSQVAGCIDVSTKISNNDIVDWQKREASAPAIETSCHISGNVFYDIVDTIAQIKGVHYKKENGTDYWQTSEETFVLRNGDCEDLAVLAYRVISDSCLSYEYDIDIRLRRIKVGKKFHVLVVLYLYNTTIFVDNFNIVTDEIYDHDVITEFDGNTIF